MILLWISGHLWAQPNLQTTFEKANEAYQKGSYEVAAQEYQSLLDAGVQNADIYYNLGNSYFRLKKPGLAILQYERGLRLQPHHSDLQHNLQVVRRQLTDEWSDLPPFFLSQWWRTIASMMSTGAWAILAILLAWLTAAAWYFWQWGAERRHRKWGFWAGNAGWLALLLVIGLGWTRLRRQQNDRIAILMSPETELKAAPDPASAEVRKVHEGARLELLDQIGDWYKVMLPDGQDGWLPEDSFERI